MLAPGNHDWLSARSPYAVTDWSPNVHLFREASLTPRPWPMASPCGAPHIALRPTRMASSPASGRTRDGTHLAIAHASERSLLGWQEAGKQPHAPFDASEIAEAG